MPLPVYRQFYGGVGGSPRQFYEPQQPLQPQPQQPLQAPIPVDYDVNMLQVLQKSPNDSERALLKSLTNGWGGGVARDQVLQTSPTKSKRA